MDINITTAIVDGVLHINGKPCVCMYSDSKQCSVNCPGFKVSQLNNDVHVDLFCGREGLSHYNVKLKRG